jgi:hypothetical protein
MNRINLIVNIGIGFAVIVIGLYAYTAYTIFAQIQVP